MHLMSSFSCRACSTSWESHNTILIIINLIDFYFIGVQGSDEIIYPIYLLTAKIDNSKIETPEFLLQASFIKGGINLNNKELNFSAAFKLL